MIWANWDISYLYFKWPWALLLLLLYVFVPFLYRNIMQERWKNALRFSYTSASWQVLRNNSKLKRLASPLLTLYIVFLLVMALTRPTAVMQVPTESVDMMMVVDISISMKAQDVQPTRLEAAKEAGLRFIRSLPRDVRVGLVFFAGTSSVQTLPTREHRYVEKLLKGLREEDLKTGTALGDGIKSALRAMQVRYEKDKEEGLATDGTETEKPPQRVIVLMSDGDQNQGYPWTMASSQALEQNVVIHTVAIGSREETRIEYQGQMYPVFLDDHTLQQIARVTQGKFYRVFKDEDFKAIYDEVRERAINFEESHEDMGFIFVGFALLLMLLQQGLNTYWLKRFP